MNAMASTAARVARVAAVALACASGMACASGGGRPVSSAPPPAVAQAQAARSQLEGTWSLVALQMADGASRRVAGSLRYDRFGTIVVHAELAADEPSLRAPRSVVVDFTAKATPMESELEYAALQDTAPSDRLAPDAVAMGEWRHFDVAGNTLRLSAKDRGGRTVATLVFERR